MQENDMTVRENRKFDVDGDIRVKSSPEEMQVTSLGFGESNTGDLPYICPDGVDENGLSVYAAVGCATDPLSFLDTLDDGFGCAVFDVELGLGELLGLEGNTILGQEPSFQCWS